jgi:MFS transporter, ENTS family, enterobactin (siderophore) exporter
MKLGSLAIDATPLKRNRDFRHLFFGRLVSIVGSSITTVAVAYQVYVLTRSSLQVGAVTLVGGVAAVAGMLYGGVLADRLNRRGMLLITQFPLAMCSAGMALDAMTHHPAVWPLYLLVGIQDLLFGIGAPARIAMVPAMVGPELYPAAAGLSSLINTLAGLVGPAVGGLLIAHVSLSAAYWCDTGAFFVYAAGIAALSPQRQPAAAAAERRSVLRSLGDGLKYTRQNPVIGSILLIDMSATFFGMPKALFPALGVGVFHGGATAVGLLYAAPGAGAVIGAVSSGWTSRVRRPGLVVLLSVCAWGLAITVFGFARALPFALVMLAAAGLADVFSEILRSTLLQLLTPDELRGRISGLWLAQANAGPALGNAEAGAVAGALGNQFSIVSGGILCIVGALFVVWRIPQFLRVTMPTSKPETERELRREDEPQSQPAAA